MTNFKKDRLFVPLNLKITLIILLGIALGGVVVIVGTSLEKSLAEKYYKGTEVDSRIQEETFKDLEKFIDENQVEGTDKAAINNWMALNKYTSLTVSDNTQIYYSSAWISKNYFGFTELQETTKVNPRDAEEDEIIDKPLARIDYNIKTDIHLRIVRFYDQDYYVNLDVYREEGLYSVMSIGMIIVAFFVLLLTVLIYNSRILKRIVQISDDVEAVSSGEIDRVITVKGNDEIGRMGHGIERMRITLIKRLASEKEAWESNRQLITSMSHDIRTPLTSMIGYLDIIEGEKYKDKAEMESYISACRDKAFQLKNLSDKLFQYFLVYGKSEKNLEWEILDGDILFQQLLTEHTAELINYGLQVELDYKLTQITVKTEVAALRRLFDNLFSNIMKYANKKDSIKIKAESIDGKISIRLENNVATEARMVESTCIGVKTCEKLVSDLGGSFVSEETDEKYITKIELPVYNEKEEGIELESIEGV
ncbi:Signal transduction histidine kinase [Peptostreptococcaceae bacterium pGA-8]|nr:Signal transduction histidine kinase [Peptostreptococcaceae bacterium pGA-8]